MYDTYFAMLEQPDLRELGISKYKILHQTLAFSREIYSRSAGKEFKDNNSAYGDWLESGRRNGLEWARGKDTLLKVILKAKDEAELLDVWIAHHAAIVGYENIIILDCGSESASYLQKLRQYSSKILILNYNRYYDHIHSPASNLDFFKLMAENCKYLTILDADEFLVGRQGSYFSLNLVKEILKSKLCRVFCGTWINVFQARDENQELDFGQDCLISLNRNALVAGTVAGKAIVSSDFVLKVGHLGHNLHAASTVEHVSENSFSDIFVLHARGLPPNIAKARALKHLSSKGALKDVELCDLADKILKLAESPSSDPAVANYARQYLGQKHVKGQSSSEETTRCLLIKNESGHRIPLLEDLIKEIDFGSILADRQAHFRGMRKL